LIGRSRAEAIGLQTIHGVAFFLDAESQRVKAVMVREAQRPTNPPTETATTPGAIDVYLDLSPDRDPVLLPVGVGLQVLDNTAVTLGPAPPPGGTRDHSLDRRDDDAYVGLNTHNANVNGVQFSYGGVILFDGYGRLVNKRYAFKFYVERIVGTMINKDPSQLSLSLEVADLDNALVDFVPPVVPMQAGSVPLRSAIGFVVYDDRTFKELGFDDADPQVYNPSPAEIYNDTAASRTPEAVEERWIDANAIPILVNRNNGTLIRGQ
jgi:hypothetical protein